MNKKFLGILAALVVLGSTGAFAGAAIGLQGGYNINAGVGGALTFKLSNVDAVFAVDGGIWGNYASLGVTADWWIANPRLAGMIHYFYGPGLAGGIGLNTGNNGGLAYIYAGGRFVVGLNVFVIDPLELYLQVAGQLGVTFADTRHDGGIYFPEWSVPLNFGFRFWF